MFKNEEKNEILKGSGTVSYFKKVVQPSKKEIEKHKEYLKNLLKKNYF